VRSANGVRFGVVARVCGLEGDDDMAMTWSPAVQVYMASDGIGASDVDTGNERRRQLDEGNYS
jgi:hypothetical protein